MHTQVALIQEIETTLVNFLEPYKKVYDKELFDFYVINEMESFEIYGNHKDEFDDSKLTKFSISFLR